jgi:hypothetical protein
MDKEHTVPKWGLIVRPQMSQNISAQIVCPSPKVRDFNEKRLRSTRTSHQLLRLVPSPIFIDFFLKRPLLASLETGKE